VNFHGAAIVLAAVAYIAALMLLAFVVAFACTLALDAIRRR
jgi:hypothetical protein